MTDPNHELEHPVTDIPDAAAPKPTRRPEDRLNIPSSIVRSSGFVPGDTAYALDHDPAGTVPKPVLVLLKAKPENSLGEYTVAKDCRIPVTPAMLKEAGLDGETFEFGGGDGKIFVRPSA